MGIERRLLPRYTSILCGQVIWGKPKRLGLKVVPTRSKMTTTDVSYGGLSVRVHEVTNLQAGSTCSVSLDSVEATATVIAASRDGDDHLLRLKLIDADPAFLQVLHQHLPSRSEVRAVEHEWLGQTAVL